jgi:hypothetical protein
VRHGKAVNPFRNRKSGKETPCLPRGAADFYPDHPAVGALGRLNIDPSFAAPKADMVRLEAFRLGLYPTVFVE